MRIVLVNHCHPETAHICATRMREFARALAARGHKVALLTQPPSDGASVPTARDIAEMLAAGIEPSPMVVATPPRKYRLLATLRRGLWPWGFRQGLIAYYYLRHGGLHPDWRAGARPYVQALAEGFRPDIVWASFGNTGTWRIAQDMARAANCPWVGDIKDFWSRFIPAPFRAGLASRYRDAAAWTALSGTHADDARRWFGDDIPVVYSGFDAESIRRAATANPNDALLMTLTGSVYGGRTLRPLFKALGDWAKNLPVQTRRRLLFIYRGNDQFEVGAALARAKLPFEAKAGGFVPLDELQALHQRAFVNLYVTNPRTFHHKAIELLAARRPIVAFPSEHSEADRIATRVGGTFHACGTVSAVGDALDEALASYSEPELPVSNALGGLSWAEQAAEAEKVFEDVLASRRGN